MFARYKPWISAFQDFLNETSIERIVDSESDDVKFQCGSGNDAGGIIQEV